MEDKNASTLSSEFRALIIVVTLEAVLDTAGRVKVLIFLGVAIYKKILWSVSEYESIQNMTEKKIAQNIKSGYEMKPRFQSLSFSLKIS